MPHTNLNEANIKQFDLRYKNGFKFLQGYKMDISTLQTQ